jgi:hypothetical protein
LYNQVTLFLKLVLILDYHPQKRQENSSSTTYMDETGPDTDSYKWSSSYVPYPIFYPIFFFSDIRTGCGSFGYWYLFHRHIKNPIFVFIKKIQFLSIRIHIRSDIKCSDSDTNYPYKVLTLSGQTNIGKYSSRFHP